MFRSFPELCAKNGFKFEEHKVTTSDGYVLTMFRIPGKFDEDEPETPKPVLFFQHGLLDSADCWIMNYAEKAPGFIAASAGYDVWLGNFRGNKYNHEHVSLSTDDKEFWEYSWPQHALYDLKAMFESIKERTGQKKLGYVGHSMGTTSMFYSLVRDQPYIQETISVFIALGPATKIAHTSSALI